MSDDLKGQETTRREVLRKSVFVAPAILTLAAVPSFASAGSGNYDDKDKKPKDEKDKKPKKDKDD